MIPQEGRYTVNGAAEISFCQYTKTRKCTIHRGLPNRIILCAQCNDTSKLKTGKPKNFPSIKNLMI